MAFIERRLNPNISRGARFTSERRVDIVELRSGHEQRNAIWAEPRRSYDISYGIQRLENIADIRRMWEEAEGPLHEFRLKDWSDFSSTLNTDQIASSLDQSLIPILAQEGDLTATRWKIVKDYGNGYVRRIFKPVDGSIAVRMAGASSDATNYSVDYATGIVTFATAVQVNSPPTIGYEYDTPVRFRDSTLTLSLVLLEVGEYDSIQLIEVLINDS